MNIIRYQLIDQHKPLLASTSYFATLQPGTMSVKVFLRQMSNVPAVCRKPVRSEAPSGPLLREASEAPPANPAGSGAEERPSLVSAAATHVTH